jgi:hypothetical protein
MPNASRRMASVALWLALVMPRVLPRASVCRKLLALPRRSEPSE